MKRSGMPYNYSANGFYIKQIYGTSVIDKQAFKCIFNECFTIVYPGKAKNAVTCSVTTFRDILKVVPPGIEPGTQGFSVLCSTN